MADVARSGDNNNGGIELEKELSCSICTDVLYQPLTLLDCLHTFCGSCLKEWFTWQATSASNNHRTAHPYTCPSCRAEVRDTRPNATVTTLLDMYLKANPDRGKNEVEKEEMRQIYKPGDDVIPPVSVQHDSEESEDERLMAEVREMSMADIDPAVAANRRADRAARHERRRRDASQGSRRSRHHPEEPSRNQQPSSWIAQQARRQQDSEERQVEHQPSLRSLLSASELDSQEVQEEIMHSILSSGVLDGIDLDNLTTQQEEELTERIAEAYRRRQRHRERSRQHERRETGERSPRTAQRSNTERTRHHTRTDSGSTPQSRQRPPISRPHLFEQGPHSPTNRHHRSASSTGHSSPRSGSHMRAPYTPPAARSATDLSERPVSRDGERERRRGLSNSNRSNTDPSRTVTLAPAPRTRAISGAERNTTDPVRSTSSLAESARREAAMPNSSSHGYMSPYPIESQPSDRAVRPAASNAAFAPELVQRSPTTAGQFQQSAEPSLSCDHCGKPEIQYNLHYNCSKCSNGNFNLCLACYREGKGCQHWFGFGYGVHYRWQRAAPPDGYQPGYERPHVLTPRRWARPDVPGTPSARLSEGAFCEQCFAFSNGCYWHCVQCLEGAWGFCDACVNRGRHCTHALRAVAHISTVRQSHQDPTKAVFVQLPHLKADSYVALPIQQSCDVCRRVLPSSTLRWHCNQCSNGNYDMCNDCYRNLVSIGKISSANGPNGWHRCPQGHRMAGIGFNGSPEEGQQRVVLHEPIGGWALKDDAPTAGASAQHQQILPPEGGVGLRCLALWSWFPAEGVMDELAFPKGAEIREAEQINQDWYWGVYAGLKGVFPGNHVRMLG